MHAGQTVVRVFSNVLFVWILKSIAHARKAKPPNIRKAASRIYEAYVCAACRFS